MPTPAPDLTPTIWHHFMELWQVLIAVALVAVAWGRMEMGMRGLKRDHRQLKAEVDMKANSSTCEIVHAQAREGQQLTLDVITKGFTDLKKEFADMRKETREEVRSVHRRLDDHIAKNGTGGVRSGG